MARNGVRVVASARTKRAIVVFPYSYSMCGDIVAGLGEQQQIAQRHLRRLPTYTLEPDLDNGLLFRINVKGLIGT
jgi:hypothetical protein